MELGTATELPSRVTPQTGSRVPAGLQTGALQIPSGSCTRAGPVLQCCAAGQGRLLRAMLPQVLLPSAQVPVMVMRSSHLSLLVLLPAAQVIVQKLPCTCSGSL